MKYILKKDIQWNGHTSLPKEINSLNSNPELAEFELLSIIATLHGMTAFDILIGASDGTDKDRDISEVLHAFQNYILPKMPLTNYNNNDKRNDNKN